MGWDRAQNTCSALMLKVNLIPTWPGPLDTGWSDKRRLKLETEAVSEMRTAILKLRFPNVSNKQNKPISWISEVLARSVCCSVWHGVRTLKVINWGEHLALSKAFSPLPVFLLVSASDKSKEQQLFVESYLVSVLAERKLAQFLLEWILEMFWYVILFDFLQHRRDLFGNSMAASDLKMWPTEQWDGDPVEGCNWNMRKRFLGSVR